MADAPPDPPLIGYFAHVREAATAWGALVLMTPDGDPLDFLYTEPVTVGRLTHALLGTRIDGYVLARVLLAPLLEQAGARLALLCLDDAALLQRRFSFEVPVAVAAAPDAPHKEGAWTAEALANGDGQTHTWWVGTGAREAAVAQLREAAAAMSPFGIVDPFRQLRAAMAEVRAERT
jgi:hypothetical protein